MTTPLPADSGSAKAIIKSFLQQWGLTSLYADVDKLFKDGLGGDAVSLRLMETKAYKERFKGNQLRESAGLPVLSPAEYLSAESAYRQALQQYGLPKSFYDQHSDFVNFIGKDISAEEVSARASAAQQVWLSTDLATKNTWREFYGLTDGAAIASILDPNRALPIVQRMATAAQLGGLAKRNGLAADRSRLEQYADLGVNAQNSAAGFAALGQTLATDQAIARRFGTTFSQEEGEQARVVGTASAQRKQRDLAEQEQALFSARAAADRNSLTRRTTGSY